MRYVSRVIGGNVRGEVRDEGKRLVHMLLQGAGIKIVNKGMVAATREVVRLYEVGEYFVLKTGDRQWRRYFGAMVSP